MSIDVYLKETGLDDVIKFLDYIDIKLPNEITIDELRWILNTAFDYAVANVVVRTGELRDSIGWEVNESQKTGMIFATADHAPHVELGTSKMSARPYMLPAIIFALQEFQKSFPGRFKDVVEK